MGLGIIWGDKSEPIIRGKDVWNDGRVIGSDLSLGWRREVVDHYRNEIVREDGDSISPVMISARSSGIIVGEVEY